MNTHNIIVSCQIQSTLSSHLSTTRLATSSVSTEHLRILFSIRNFLRLQVQEFVWYSSIGLCHSAQTVELYTANFGCDILLVTIQDVNYTIILDFIQVGRY